MQFVVNSQFTSVGKSVSVCSTLCGEMRFRFFWSLLTRFQSLSWNSRKLSPTFFSRRKIRELSNCSRKRIGEFSRAHTLSHFIRISACILHTRSVFLFSWRIQTHWLELLIRQTLLTSCLRMKTPFQDCENVQHSVFKRFKQFFFIADIASTLSKLNFSRWMEYLRNVYRFNIFDFWRVQN